MRSSNVHVSTLIFMAPLDWSHMCASATSVAVTGAANPCSTRAGFYSAGVVN